MLIEIVALGLLSGIFWKRKGETEPGVWGEDQVTESSVKSVFAGPHDPYPRGAEDLMIDRVGARAYNIFAQGNPEPRNPMNQLFTYPQSKVSSEINKNNERWQSVGILNKETQLDFIQEKIAMDDHILLTAHYKQRDGKTVSAKPKINLKNRFDAARNTFGKDISREGALRRHDGHYA
jgi:hypothetical protein